MHKDHLFSRKIVRAACVCLIAITGLVTGLVTGAAAGSPKTAPQEASAEDFTAVVGKRFKTTLPNGVPVDVNLYQVIDLASADNRPANLSRQSAFVAVFDAPQWMDFEEKIYLMRNGKLGEMEMLLQPVVMADGQRYLEAVFN